MAAKKSPQKPVKKPLPAKKPAAKKLLKAKKPASPAKQAKVMPAKLRAKAADLKMPIEGAAAPDFSAVDGAGKTIRLSDFKGTSVVLYFYPKDDTPGCTVEACDFRDHHSQILKRGAVVLGVSPDNGKSHQKFATKHGLGFPLLVDESHDIGHKYGTWGEKSMYGRKYMGMFRSTFLIGADQKIKKVWPKVSVTGHVDEVLAAL